ncbi:MAG: COG1615 family transporter, partial [Synergistaceae bacterium]|nr:COG1615 family transporter [Synergistaceae bacterium]
FAIIVPYMPLGRDNLIGWMAGRCDPGNYGELLVYQFPKQKLIYGPAQIEALINQKPEISSQLSLWSQRGSDVIIGDLLVVPIGKSLLYVQPLYLKAENGELPELKRVIVSTGGRVEWDETFAGALEKLIGKKVAEKGSTLRPGSVADMVGGSENGDLSGDNALGAKDISALAKFAQELYNSAQEAQRQGNWALYGDKIKELGKIISELEERSK